MNLTQPLLVIIMRPVQVVLKITKNFVYIVTNLDTLYKIVLKNKKMKNLIEIIKIKSNH